MFFVKGKIMMSDTMVYAVCIAMGLSCTLFEKIGHVGPTAGCIRNVIYLHRLPKLPMLCRRNTNSA